MRSHFHVALHEIVGHQEKYGDRVETVPTMTSVALRAMSQIPLRLLAD